MSQHSTCSRKVGNTLNACRISKSWPAVLIIVCYGTKYSKVDQFNMTNVYLPHSLCGQESVRCLAVSDLGCLPRYFSWYLRLKVLQDVASSLTRKSAAEPAQCVPSGFSAQYLPGWDHYYLPWHMVSLWHLESLA